MTYDELLSQIEALGGADTASSELDLLARSQRAELDLATRLELAAELWAQNPYPQARILAAKLLTQARISDDEAVWALLTSWLNDFDDYRIDDHVATALQKRLLAAPERIESLTVWNSAENPAIRRAVFTATRGFARLPHPSEAELAAREQILTWAASALADKDWALRKAIVAWLRDLSKHDQMRVKDFLDRHTDGLKAWIRKEAGQYLEQ